MYVIGITDESKHIWAGLREGTLSIGCVIQDVSTSSDWLVISRDATVITLLEGDVKFTNLQVSHATNVTFAFHGERDALMNALIGIVGNIKQFIDLPLVS